MAPVYLQGAWHWCTFKVHGTVVLWASPFKVHGTVVLWHRYLGTGISGILALKYFGSAPIAERQMSPKAIAMN